jgi:hypothetical protein
MKLKEICKECVHRPTCALPCRPVELHLAEGQAKLFERTYYDVKSGRKLTVLYSNSRRSLWDKEIRQSELKRKGDAEDKFDTFSTEAENPFASFNPKLQQTGIFIDRLIRRMPFEDIAVKYDLANEAAARDRCREAVLRLHSLLLAMDSQKQITTPAKRLEQQKDVPKSSQWFIMSRVLGMTPVEIAEFTGANASTVCSGIQNVHDQLAAGEKDLILFSPEQRRAAKSRLERQRQRDRRRIRRKNNQNS